MKRNVLQDGNGSDTVMIEGLGMYVPMSQVRSMQAEIERLHSLAERMKQEAEGHAQEARTQRSTVHDIYQALGVQKGGWNGKVPVVEKFAAVEQERDQLKAAVALALDTFEQYQMDVDTYPPVKHVSLMQNLKGVLAKHDAEVIDRFTAGLCDALFPHGLRRNHQTEDGFKKIAGQVQQQIIRQHESNGCELECGAHGTFCRCKAEAEQTREVQS